MVTHESRWTGLGRENSSATMEEDCDRRRTFSMGPAGRQCQIFLAEPAGDSVLLCYNISGRCENVVILAAPVSVQ
jgi:hypothetical protein